MDLNQPFLEGLTYKQKLFVLHYNGNATQAAKKAGYSPKNAFKIGSDLLQRSTIAEALRARDNGNGQRKHKILSDEKIRELWSEIAINTELPLKERIAALDKLAKSRGMYIDKLQISGTIEHLSDSQLERKFMAALAVLGVDPGQLDAPRLIDVTPDDTVSPDDSDNDTVSG